jgi:serine/threonine-protein kinase RsbT
VSVADLDFRSECARAVIEVLEQYVSPLNARSVFRLACQRARLRADAIGYEHVDAIATSIEHGLSFFVHDRAEVARCVTALRATAAKVPRRAEEPAREIARRTAIRLEMDVVVARNEGRSIARDVGFTETGRTRVATVISELARNIVRYAGEGEIVLRGTRAPVVAIEIVARDQGPGIADLAAILEGRYRSRDGMGLGLRGVKSVSSRFDVRTGKDIGTTITARIEGC